NPPIVLYGTAAILVAGYLAVHLPVSAQVATAAIRQLGTELEESARISGSSWVDAMRRITMPLLRDPLIGAWLLVYVLAIRDLSVALLLYSPKTIVMSVGLYDLWLRANNPALAAYSVVFLVVGYAPLVLWRLTGRRALEAEAEVRGA